MYKRQVVEWTVSKEMQNAGFKDSFREIHPEPEKNIGTTWIYDNEDKPLRSDRIDFIYYQGKTIRAITSESYNQELTKPLKFMGEEFFYPSDHLSLIHIYGAGQSGYPAVSNACW